MECEINHIKPEDCAAATHEDIHQAFENLSKEYGDWQQAGGYTKAIGQIAAHGAQLGLSIGVLTNMPATGYFTLSAMHDVTKAGFGYLIKGGAAAAADAGVDMLLQKGFGRDVGGHDIFRPTQFESMGLAAAAIAPLDTKGRLLVASAAWLEGRIENYFLR